MEVGKGKALWKSSTRDRWKRERGGEREEEGAYIGGRKGDFQGARH